MKLVRCDGTVYEVHDIGPCVVRLRATPTSGPIKAHGVRLVEEGEARAELRALLDLELYARDLLT